MLLLGNLGADPELRNTNSGTAVMKMRIATSETYFDRNKEKQERTEWHNVVVWGKRAEGLAKFLAKGHRIFVEGGLRTTSYENKGGQKVYRTEIVASNIIVAGGGRDGGGQRKESSGAGGGGYGDEDYGASAEDDDVPF